MFLIPFSPSLPALLSLIASARPRSDRTLLSMFPRLQAGQGRRFQNLTSIAAMIRAGMMPIRTAKGVTARKDHLVLVPRAGFGSSVT